MSDLAGLPYEWDGTRAWAEWEEEKRYRAGIRAMLRGLHRDEEDRLLVAFVEGRIERDPFMLAMELLGVHPSETAARVASAYGNAEAAGELARDPCPGCGVYPDARSPADKVYGVMPRRSLTGYCYWCDYQRQEAGADKWESPIQRSVRLAARDEQRRQMARLREGRRTLAAIRRILRAPSQSPSAVSEPARTSRT